ncbi:MAG: hypothetical protein F6J90_32035 [Moorea sp. SIOASIH]|uniref:hypothetical protein n=1 Tax=Moorena sp. SIOASIH TaxID=2607817 RepID=UPI0013BE4E44|nr:hypothetical protein [Moorena sp. SIOASIH]NEO40716.1 hypothetical protein [Moorena sp. SIOASIH]
MKEKLEQRLQSLKTEFDAGQKLLAEYETKQMNLRETLLRISGAIQVIEEELRQFTEAENEAENNSQPVETEAGVVDN